MSELEKINAEIRETEEIVATLKKQREGVIQAAAKIKTELEELSRRWDYLDPQGVHTEKQRRIAEEMETRRSILKGLTGEESRH
jgi:hypothetical protein